MNKTIIAIGDIHLPFHDRKALERAYQVISKFEKVDAIVQLGDLADFFSYGRWPRKLEVISPKDEYRKAREYAERFWQRLQKIQPKASCYQILGNHDERPLKAILDRAPEFHHIAHDALREFFTFPGVSTQPSERDELLLHGILFHHGYRAKLGDHCRHNRQNTVNGHSHTGGVYMERFGDSVIWELNAGYLGDPCSVPMGYTRQRIVAKWTHGIGVIDTLGPRFIPL